MEYVNQFITLTYGLLNMQVDFFGFSFSFFEIDVFIMVAGIFIYVVRSLLFRY